MKFLFKISCNTNGRLLVNQQLAKYLIGTSQDHFFLKSLSLVKVLRRHKHTTSSKEKLVILGTGWGSFSLIKNISRKRFDVTVVSPRNHFLFTPLLCSTTVGTLEFRSIISPVRNVCFRKSFDFHLSSAVDLQANVKLLVCQSELPPYQLYTLPYDKLVIGVGALSNTFNIPGVKEHAFFLKELADARKIRDQIIVNFELAMQPMTPENEQKRLLHFVIVGGGPTGVEFGAELYDFLREDVSRLYKNLHDKVRVTLIESSRILGSFDKALRDYAEIKIRRRSQFNILQSSVSKVESTRVLLKDGREIPCALVVWSTGLAPRSFTKVLTFPKDKYGHILTDQKLQVRESAKNTIFALGDCANIDILPLPSTAQVAERQGKWLASYLNGKTTKDFQFTNFGMLAYVGGYSGLSDLRSHLFKFKGFFSWFLWRSAYLTRLGTWKLRMQVVFDWFKTLLFGRDGSRF